MASRPRKNSSSEGSRSRTTHFTKNKKRLVKACDDIDSKRDVVDNGEKIAEAVVAQLQGRAGTEIEDGAFIDENAYRDPAILKWRIFEAVAKTNGQR